ncbi:hypothetical protein PHYPSEUDO_007767 [Phytophthora pseudosyringae]|uniref:Transmembrane protein n=1 Tax=Phytophthora pseudosyringae TaxID=221518 RepID=A0A8T1VIY7_9STRA|nr:hypothetical protein PHYPSEUDO_007767 [Phytophthora pseudosyringae]
MRLANRCMGRAMTALRSVQVELQGKYSIERVYQLDQYSWHTGTLHVVATMVLTPLPCLLSVVVMEVIPLADWRLGLPHSLTFWVRGFLVVFLIAFAVLEQGRHFVPRLPMTDAQLWGSSLFTAAGTAVVTYGISSAVGFPLPFTIACGSPQCCFFLVVCIVMFWGKFLMENAVERNRLVKYILVVTVQVAMSYVYPAYNFIFVHLSSSAQMAFAFMLPVLKILIKNWIGFLFRDMDDFKPELVILNAEIFHALFVSWCMQRSTSTYTTVLLMVMDFLEATLSLRDIGHLMKTMNGVLRSVNERLLLSPSHDNPAPSGDSPNLLTLSMLIWEKDGSILESSGIRFSSHIPKRSFNSVHPNSAVIGPITNNSSVESFENPWNAKLGHLMRGKELDIRHATKLDHETSEYSKRKLGGVSGDSPTNSYAQEIVDEMSKSERLQYLQCALQVLHIAEFLVLVELTEVMIPMVYCIYLSIVYRLPNKVYYSQLRGVDDATLQRNLLSVMTYSFLELVSFLMLCYMLQRKVGVSSIRQLTFVLSSQWQVAQSKFVLWIVHSVQAPLDHFGADFSFQFQWLHGNTTSIWGE